MSIVVVMKMVTDGDNSGDGSVRELFLIAMLTMIMMMLLLMLVVLLIDDDNVWQ